jgi:hypothetical protein
MRYCRFQNTLADLNDCWESMDDDDLSKAEESARRSLVALCDAIASAYVNPDGTLALPNTQQPT